MSSESLREDGIQTESYIKENDDGSVYRLINIGVPSNHPLADPYSKAGASSLHNLKIGPISLPVAPTFTIRVRAGRENRQPMGLDSQQNPHVPIGSQSPSLTEVATLVTSIETMAVAINSILM